MDFAAMMKQAQLVQQKLAEAQARMGETTVSGTAGGGLVTVDLQGTGDMIALKIDDSLLVKGEGDVLADLVRAAYADARTKLGQLNRQLIQEASKDLGGGLPDLPNFF